MSHDGERRCRSILIVEDDDDIREALDDLLSDAGYEVFGAANGLQGLDVLARMPRPCLILLDLLMPVMNGQDFLAAQHEDDAIATIPVVVVSAYENRARGLDVRGFVKKPVDLGYLMGLVERCCGAPLAEQREAHAQGGTG